MFVLPKCNVKKAVGIGLVGRCSTDSSCLALVNEAFWHIREMFVSPQVLWNVKSAGIGLAGRCSTDSFTSLVNQAFWHIREVSVLAQVLSNVKMAAGQEQKGRKMKVLPTAYSHKHFFKHSQAMIAINCITEKASKNNFVLLS